MYPLEAPAHRCRDAEVILGSSGRRFVVEAVEQVEVPVEILKELDAEVAVEIEANVPRPGQAWKDGERSTEVGLVSSESVEIVSDTG